MENINNQDPTRIIAQLRNSSVNPSPLESDKRSGWYSEEGIAGPHNDQGIVTMLPSLGHLRGGMSK